MPSPPPVPRPPPASPRRGVLAAVALAALLAAGCAGRREVDLSLDLESVALSQAGTAPLSTRWWAAFEVPALDAAMDEALGRNFDVQAAYARFRAADATVRRTRAQWLPTVGATVDASVSSDDLVDGLQQGPVALGLDLTYEVDLWGRIRSQVKGDAARRDAAEAQARAAALALSAAVATTWIDLAATQEQLALLERQVAANEQMSAIVRSRVLNGVVRQADSLRQDRLVEQTRTERVARLEDREILEHRLAVLMGRPPTDVPEGLPARLPELPPLPEVGLTSELLRRRPDVQAAEQAMIAADADLAAAVRDLYPRFDLRAGVDNAPLTPEALLTDWNASLGARLTAPLYEGGRKRAEIQRVRAVLEAQVADYTTALLVALREVEDAITRNRRQAETVALIDRQVALATQTADNLQLQYVGGLDVGYLDVLTAQTTAQQLLRQQIAARQRLLSLRVDLYRALAGGFDPALDDDADG